MCKTELKNKPDFCDESDGVFPMESVKEQSEFPIFKIYIRVLYILYIVFED